MTGTITLTEEELEILLQALSARDNQLRYHTDPNDMRRIALPIVQSIKTKTGEALTALWDARRAA